jgi:hypothetical protein
VALEDWGMARRSQLGATILAGLTSGLLSITATNAGQLDKIQELANNFSHENMICGAYFLFVSECLKRKDPADPLAETYKTGAGTFINRSIETGKLAGVSAKALSARMDIAIADQKSETENNCTNIAVLFQKHATNCKSLMEDGPKSLADGLEALGIK